MCVTITHGLQQNTHGRLGRLQTSPAVRTAFKVANRVPCALTRYTPLNINNQTSSRPISTSTKAVEEIVLPVVAPQVLEDDAKWLATEIQTWLDEEWTPLEVHQRLGEAAGRAYYKARMNDANEVGDILLAVTGELFAFDFFDTFTSPFEVGNKVSELLMLRDGCDVCCTKG